MKDDVRYHVHSPQITNVGDVLSLANFTAKTANLAGCQHGIFFLLVKDAWALICSLVCLVIAGISLNTSYVLGSNHLIQRWQLILSA